jgi:hypothetical protein
MADLKETTAAGLQVLRPATEPQDVVRKQELDTELAALAKAADVTTEIAAATASPVSVDDTDSVALTLADGTLTADMRVPSDTTIQAAGGSTSESFGHPIAVGDTLTLAKRNVTISAVELRDGSDTLLASGVAGTDYEADAYAGTLFVLPDSGIATATGQHVKVSYTYGAVTDGSALTVDANGIHVNMGTAHNQAARGDHTHSTAHLAASGAATQSATVTVSPGQIIYVAVVLDPAGNLSVGAAGISVTPDVFANADHDHALATSTTFGFMSAEDKLKLDGLTGALPSFVDSRTVAWTTSNSGASYAAAAKLGAGLTIDESGLAIDWTLAAQKGHTHDNATGTVPGFMTAAQFNQLAGMYYTFVGFAENVSSGVPIGFDTAYTSNMAYWSIVQLAASAITMPYTPVATDFTSWIPFNP